MARKLSPYSKPTFASSQNMQSENDSINNIHTYFNQMPSLRHVVNLCTMFTPSCLKVTFKVSQKPHSMTLWEDCTINGWIRWEMWKMQCMRISWRKQLTCEQWKIGCQISWQREYNCAWAEVQELKDPKLSAWLTSKLNESDQEQKEGENDGWNAYRKHSQKNRTNKWYQGQDIE